MENHNEIARLNQKVKRLSTLIEVNEMISSSLEIDTILENVMTISKKVMNADASSLMRIDEKTNELSGAPAAGASAAPAAGRGTAKARASTSGSRRPAAKGGPR